ncbi:MAG: hypothetical protein ACKV2V_09325 [Blastocatellia bacterium]
MIPISAEQISAADEMYNVIQAKLSAKKGHHHEVRVACSARMAGTFLMRSFNLSLDNYVPGDMVESEEANEKGKNLVEVMDHMLTFWGVTLDPTRVSVENGFGTPLYFGLLETQDRLEADYDEIRLRYELDYEIGSYAASLAVAWIIADCAKELDPHISFNIAVWGFLEGTRTAPRKLKAIRRSSGAPDLAG